MRTGKFLQKKKKKKERNLHPACMNHEAEYFCSFFVMVIVGFTSLCSLLKHCIRLSMGKKFLTIKITPVLSVSLDKSYKSRCKHKLQKSIFNTEKVHQNKKFLSLQIFQH